MKDERANKSAFKSLSLIVVLLIIAGGLLGGLFMFSDLMMEEYATFNSPDGKYKIVVMRSKEFLGTAPGQAGDSPGEVRLYNKKGDLLEKTEVEMVQLVENVEWTDKSAYIKLVVDWNLPE